MAASRTVRLADGMEVPAIGQGTWYMGEDNTTRKTEVRALQTGLDQGLTLIDTAEMYAEGNTENVVGEAIAGRREWVFLVSKVYPHNADVKRAITACEQSLKRLHTDYLDLYLLHWRGSIPLSNTIEAMERLREAGKIRRWGVSNFDTRDMQDLWKQAGGDACVTNQVLYHAGSRGIEFDLQPWCREQAIPIMAYCPLAQAGQLRIDLLENPVIRSIAEESGTTPAQIALAWVIRNGDVIAIPKAAQEQHVKENALASLVHLSEEDLRRIEQAFSAPTRKEPLDIV